MKRRITVTYARQDTNDFITECFEGEDYTVVLFGEESSLLVVTNSENEMLLGVPLYTVITVRTETEKE